MGATGGEAAHTLTEPELPALVGSAHIASGHIANWTVADPSGIVGPSGDNGYGDVGGGNHIAGYPDTINVHFGNNQPHNNLPPYMIVNYEVVAI